MPPLNCVQQWRMCLAERALRDGDTTVGALAASLGYASESAFKRRTGVAPRAYRAAAQRS
ncbi:helix-turn-helix domain-containing protein [Dactylosporangium sp. McL0621]|uniref:helix-turn-helix domain-containing protein n=1 Tax=Dactylosporangium sp. McL0621 TaxID=3415678 RepID=UPI003CF94C89